MELCPFLLKLFMEVDAALAAMKKTCAKYFFQKRIKKYLTKLIHIFIIFTVKGEIFLRGNLT